MSDESIIKEARQRFDDATQRWSENFARTKDDIYFGRLGEQWPDDIKAARKRDSRPMLTINRVPAFLRQVTNDARINKPQIKARPVDSNADPETAEVLNGLIRNIQSTSDADVAYDTAIDNSASGGIGFIRIDMDYARNDTFELDICIKPVENVTSVMFDPMTKAYDSGDWEYAFVSDIIPLDTFKRKYPNAEQVDFDSWGVDQQWLLADGVRVAEYWDRAEYDRKIIMLSNGMVVDEKAIEPMIPQLAAAGVTPQQSRIVKGYNITHRLMTGVEVLRETKWVGSIIPVIPVYGEIVNYEGRRYWRSLFRDAKDSQRMLNYWYSAAVEKTGLSTKAPWVGPASAFEGFEDIWNNANTESYAYLPFNDKAPLPPQRDVGTPMPTAEYQNANIAADNMKGIMGIFDASLGARSNETSGRAIMARQREGDISTYHFIDNLARSIKCAGRCIIEMIPHVYNTERVIRVLGEDGKPNMVEINKRVEENGISRVLNDLTIGHYDVTVDVGPSTTSRREESAQAMVEMVRSFPDAAPVLGDLIAKAQDWPDADKVAERLRFLLPEPIRAAEEAKQADENGQQQVETMLSQAQQAIAQKDQQLAEIQKQMADVQKAFDDRQADLEKTEASVDKKLAELNEQMAALKLEQERTAFEKKAALDSIQIAQERAALEAQKRAIPVPVA